MEHNVYFDGAVQSLDAQSGKGTDFAVRVVEPGEYNFGKATRREEICVLLGVLYINGKRCFARERQVITIGEVIIIKANSTAAYLCRYY